MARQASTSARDNSFAVVLEPGQINVLQTTLTLTLTAYLLLRLHGGRAFGRQI